MNEVLRQEKKALISLSQFYQYSHQFGHIMAQDAHNNQGGYDVRSLYFDTIDDRDYQEKDEGVELRRKIRLRNYGANSPYAKLEIKQKQGALQKKRSLKMPKADAMRLIQRDYSVLLAYQESFADECYYLLNTHCYSPKAVIEYKRTAFIAKENDIRITFDHHIIGTESNYDIFSDQLIQNPLMDTDLVVLEVKYNGFLLSYIKDMLEVCNTSTTSVSKYCLGRTVSKHYLF